MARTFLTWMLLMCSLSVLQAADGASENSNATDPKPAQSPPLLLPLATEPTSGNASTLGADPGNTSTKQAVHVNPTGINSAAIGEPNSVVDRLRAVRDAVLIPPVTPKTAANLEKSGILKPNVTSAQAPGLPPSSRRRQLPPQNKSTGNNRDAASVLVAPVLDPNDQVTKLLPSVMKRSLTDPVASQADKSAGNSSQPAGSVPVPAAAVPTLAVPTPAASAKPVPAAAIPTAADPSRATRQPTSVASRAGTEPFATRTDTPNQREEPRPLSAPIHITEVVDDGVVGEEDSLSSPAVQEGFTELPAFRSDDDSETTDARFGPQFAEPRVSEPQVTEPLSPADSSTAPRMTIDTSSRQKPFEVTDQPAGNTSTGRAATGSPSVIRRPAGESPLRSEASAGSAVDPKIRKIDDDVLLSNRSPVLIVKTHGRQTIRVGRPASYFVSAVNAGDLAAEDVLVSIKVPAWAEVSSQQATTGLVRTQPDEDGDTTLQWSIPQLPEKDQQRLRIDLIPRSSRPIELGVTWNFKSVSAVTQIQVQEPKLKMSVVGPEDIQYGETKLYTISVSNPGSGDAENVLLTLMPINNGSGSAGVRELGTVKPGMRRTVEVELTARQAGELAVRASATADGGLKAQGEQRVIVRRAELKVEAVGPPMKYAGTNGRFGIKVTNIGDATARDVVAVASLPLAAKFISGTGNGTFDASAGKVRWGLGALRPGAFQIVELTTTLESAGENRLDVRATAEADLSAIASVTTNVESQADLKLTVNDPRGAVPINSEMVYEVRIVNRGTKEARKVHAVGYFSEGIEPLSVRGWRATVDVGQVTFDVIPRIAPGQEIIAKVSAKAQRPGNHVFRAEVESHDPETKLAVEEWTKFYGESETPSLLGPTASQSSDSRR